MDHDRVLEDIASWASGDDNVRLVVLTGSLARGSCAADPLSDLDVELYVRDPLPLLETREWYGEFGEVLIVEELENPGWHPTRLVYYVDGKIDFMVGPVSALDAGVTYERGYRVLLDKDGLGGRLRRQPAPASPPTGEELTTCVHWFWAAALMEAKAIVRDEPWAGKVRDWDLKTQLLRMIEWDHRVRYGWDFDTWHLGVHMREWMGGDVQDELKRCWAGFDPAEARSALVASVDLIDRLARRTAIALGLDQFDAAPVRAEIDRILRMPARG